ncbi:CpaE family protein [Microbacterium sp. P04]|uniref:AAA family ATPase n=1 Tax=Microbacterium sp. P04 TaxID=3366947 RepID=UPI003745E99B
MMRIVVAVDAPRGARLAEELAQEGVHVAAVVGAESPAEAPDASGLEDTDVLVLHVTRTSLTRELVAACDAHGTRIAALCDDEAGRRVADARGLAASLPVDVEGWVLADALAAPAALAAPGERRRDAAAGAVIAVWGPHGSPGRSTVAIEVAAELSRGGRSVALVDADAHAPSIALTLGVADEGPGFAAACRQAEIGGLDPGELERISTPVHVSGGRIDLLVGINRPSRWPELSATRVTAALAACRPWVDHVVVDVAASLEADEEIVSDLDGPRRNAATLASLAAADTVIAVLSADPVGVARFLRAYTELRAVVGATRVVVVANRLRPGTLGVDARGQVRRTLERYAGIEDVWFVPLDPRSADAAILAARPVGETAPRSPLATGVRRLVGEAVAPAPHPVAVQASRRSRAVRRRLPRSA